MKQPGRRRRPPWWTVAIAVAFVYLVLGIWAIYLREFTIRRNAGWVDSERRKLRLVHHPEPHPNAFDTYAEAVDLLKRSGVASELVNDWSVAVIMSDAATADALEAGAREALRAAGPAVERMRQAAGQEYLSRPDAARPQAYAWLYPDRKAARVAAAEAIRHHGDSDDAGALREVEDVLALGVALSRGSEQQQTRCGAGIIGLGGQCGRFVLAHTTAPAMELRLHAGRMRALRARMTPLSETVAATWAVLMAEMAKVAPAVTLERAVQTPRNPEAESMSKVGRVRVWATTNSSFDESMQWIEDRFARLAEAADAPFGDTSWDELVARICPDARSRRDYWAGIAAGALDRQLHSDWLRAQGDLIAEEAIACIQAYRIEHGEYPESLHALLPDYMPELPVDPWTGETMVYRRTDEGFTLYAVGANGVDDGGVCDPRDAARVDQVFVPMPPVAPERGSTESSP